MTCCKALGFVIQQTDMAKAQTHLHKDIGWLPGEGAPAPNGQEVTKEEQEPDVAYHPVHLLAKDGCSSQRLHQTPERAPRAWVLG